MSNEQILISLMLQATLQASRYATIINNARAQGRDVSDDELNAAAAADDVARERLQGQIDAA
jgi:hypothetical protein